MSGEADGGKLVPQGEDAAQIELWKEMAALERERIASRDRLTEVAKIGFANLDAVDERHFQFQKDRLERDDSYRNRRLSHIVKFGWAGVGVAVSVLSVLIFMTFWGTEEQRGAAVTWMSIGGALLLGILIGRYRLSSP